LLCLLLSGGTGLFAQDNTGQKDSLVRLVSAKFIEQIERGDDLIRKAEGATFLHNGTYLISDSSVWSLNNKIINFTGNVRMMQGDAELTSEKLDYFIDDNLARFEGGVVELRNKQGNTLRTLTLDYNTRDSMAVFSGGAAMRGENGQIIESDNGRYYNALNLFSFQGNVNMYTDSVFVKTDSLKYNSDASQADFISHIDFWKDGNMLSAERGWFNDKSDVFFFRDKVHALTKTQETWCDTLYYYRTSGDVLMLGEAQLQDSTRNVAGLSDRIHYEQAKARVTMRGRAAVALWQTSQEGKTDTTYCGADTLVYRSIPKCDIPAAEINDATKRLEAITGDPVSEFRKRAAEEAAKEKEEALSKKTRKRPKAKQVSEVEEQKEDEEEVSDTTGVAVTAQENLDTLAFSSPAAIAQAQDSLTLEAALPPPPPPDSTKVGFVRAIGDVRVFRKDMQLRSDTLRFNELDSIARFYKEPIIWNEGRRQYTSDSLFVLVKSEGVDRANLMSNAFIAVNEDSVHFDQIKSSEVMAYFDGDAALRRFDALGGVSAIFFMEENDVIATANIVESRMLSATLKDGDLERVYYFENPKNDAKPVAQMKGSEMSLKGFNWTPERRPTGKEDISPLEVRPTERPFYAAISEPAFAQTKRFFPGHIDSIYKELEEAKNKKRTAATASSGGDISPTDSLSLGRDSLDVFGEGDSLFVAGSDTTALKDSLSVTETISSPQEEEPYMSERELRRALRIARRDARWAELDKRDTARQEQKDAKAAEKRRRKAAKAAARRAKQQAKDDALLQKYIDLFEKQKAENERKTQSEPTRERTSGVETGGEV